MLLHRKQKIPVFMDDYLKTVELDDRKPPLDIEIQAYEDIASQIENEKDPFLKQLMQDKLRHYCDGYVTEIHGMLLSYIKNTYWDQEIDRDRKILSLSDLYTGLESILAAASDSSGYTKQYGSNRRYPINIRRFDGTVIKPYFLSIGDDISPEEFLRAYYSFGVHKFHAGQVLAKIIEFLELRYNLDFEKLENDRD